MSFSFTCQGEPDSEVLQWLSYVWEHTNGRLQFFYDELISMATLLHSEFSWFGLIKNYFRTRNEATNTQIPHTKVVVMWCHYIEKTCNVHILKEGTPTIFIMKSCHAA